MNIGDKISRDLIDFKISEWMFNSSKKHEYEEADFKKVAKELYQLQSLKDKENKAIGGI